LSPKNQRSKLGGHGRFRFNGLRADARTARAWDAVIVSTPMPAAWPRSPIRGAAPREFHSLLSEVPRGDGYLEQAWGLVEACPR
jgi:hypothetical protein